ncbi:hypothetical protein PFISCL1PPCAC_4868, partial [Pristionchus fissidentatus]
ILSKAWAGGNLILLKRFQSVMSSLILSILLTLISSSLVSSKPLVDINIRSAIRELESLSTNSRDFLNYVYFWTILSTLLACVLIAMICCIFNVVFYMIYKCFKFVARCARKSNSSSKNF